MVNYEIKIEIREKQPNTWPPKFNTDEIKYKWVNLGNVDLNASSIGSLIFKKIELLMKNNFKK